MLSLDARHFMQGTLCKTLYAKHSRGRMQDTLLRSPFHLLTVHCTHRISDTQHSDTYQHVQLGQSVMLQLICVHEFTVYVYADSLTVAAIVFKLFQVRIPTTTQTSGKIARAAHYRDACLICG